MSFDTDKFDPSSHDVSEFSCGAKMQDDYLKKHARDNMEMGYGVTYVALNGSEVVGFYTLAAGNVKFKNLPDDFREGKDLPKYPAPTLLLAQLGVDTSWQGGGLGSALVADAVIRAADLSKSFGAVAIEVHAYTDEVRSFYDRFGFVQLKDNKNHLFLSMSVARTLKEEEKAPKVSS
jgi:GNAT superfamily N-acetyltransferase